MTASLMWFRRDLRLSDNPALLEACADGAVLPLFVYDPALWDPAGPSRRAYLSASLRALDDQLRLRHGRLSVVQGDPVREVVIAAEAVGAKRVHIAADYGPYGRRRDHAVDRALAQVGIDLVRTGSPYAVAPGRVHTQSGDPYKVFTPFSRAWFEHGWRAPVDAPSEDAWLELGRDHPAATEIRDPELPPGLTLPAAGEAAAVRRWREFLDHVEDYEDLRNDPGRDATSRLSVHLKYGEIHPRTLLADLSPLGGPGVATFRKELAWREFYADVLNARPETARDYLRPEFAHMTYDRPEAQYDAWREGRTGFPIVDAGMRQLRRTGWMHNRVRMIVASFLVKDLHLEWQHGARHFMEWLVDGDLASNQHGWQWTAGCGTDASPFFRVFNPIGQSRRFDPSGEYLRRWIDELADPAAVPDPHEPDPAVRRAVGYPAPMLDHAAERREALDRWDQIRNS